MTRPAQRVRFLDVMFTNEYGQKRVVAHVSNIDPESGEIRRESAYHTDRTTGRFSGEALEDFRISCYLGHGHDPSGIYAGEQASLWGWAYEYKPFVIDSTRTAERILKTMRAIEREQVRLYGLIGGTPTFALWLRRMAAIVGAVQIRVWIPRQGSVTSHLSDGLSLAEGADLVVAIATAWGNSRYAEAGSLVSEMLGQQRAAEVA